MAGFRRAGGSAKGSVVHLRQTAQTHREKFREEKVYSCLAWYKGEKKKDITQVTQHALTLLTASVAMPSMAAPPTPSTSLALDSTKSMADPSPLSSFFPFRSPFTPAILHQSHKEGSESDSPPSDPKSWSKCSSVVYVTYTPAVCKCRLGLD